MTAMLEAALGYTSTRGWYLFPCRADKQPLTTHGVLDSSNDPEQLRAWWKQWPLANIGLDCGKSGLLVFDLDPGSDLEELKVNLSGDWRDTPLRATTPRGGSHLIYRLHEGEAVRASASAVARNIDIRSFHSYILIAPSRTDAGTYTWADPDAKPAIRTDAMPKLCNAAREKSKDRDEWIIEPDLEENVAAAIQWLKHEARPAIEGQGGDHTAYATAAMMKTYGISQSNAFDLIWEFYNGRCDPPWVEENMGHLESKVEHAYAYNTSPPGHITPAYKIAKNHALFQTVEHVALESGKQRNMGRFRFVDREGMDHIKPPEWLLPDLMPDKGYGMLYGPPGSGKTFLALDIALTIAAGFPENPVHGLPVHPGPVLYTVGEARSGITRRVKAWEALHFHGSHVDNFVLADPVPAPHEEDWNNYIAGALDLHPNGYELVILDTVGRSMQGMNENSQEDASKFTRLVEHLQKVLDCAILAIHHSGKEGGPERGSSVFKADVDVMLVANKPTKGPGLVTLAMEKQKDDEEWKQPRYIELTKHLKSLVAMPGEAPKPDVTEDPEAQRTVLQLHSDALLKVLEANPTQKWSTTDLAEAVSASDRIESDSTETARKWVKKVFGMHTVANPVPAARCYDAATKAWRWREPE